MRSLASEVCNEGGIKKLRLHRDKERCMLIKRKGMRERARLTIKGKSEFRKRWKRAMIAVGAS